MDSELLWIDKYSPSNLEELDFNQAQTQMLMNLAQGSLPHILLYGPSGSGKKTRIMCLLQRVFGDSVYQLKMDTQTFKSGSTKVEINVLQSNHHIDINPSDVGHHDRIVIQNLIKQIGSNRSVTSEYKVLVINAADCLTNDAQAALRRTMEKYTATVRLILICNNLSKIIPPILSRCQSIRNPNPTDDDLITILQKVANAQKFKLDRSLGQQIVNTNKKNLRRCINSLQILRITNPQMKNCKVPQPQYEILIQEIAHKVLQEQSIETIKYSRSKLYELFTQCIPANIIFQHLSDTLCTQLQSTYPGLCAMVCEQAAHYESTAQQGTKFVMHVEAFIAKIMMEYRKAAVQNVYH